jgi:activator of HSP90 ATPase
MTYEFKLSAEFVVTPNVIFESWLSSEGHTAMTGGIAHMSTEIGAVYDAWDGYISGKNIEIEQDRRFVQSWRTSHFAPEDPDSLIEIMLEPVAEGTLLSLKHQNVPDGQTSYEEYGWNAHYFEPMKKRFEWLKMNSAK